MYQLIVAATTAMLLFVGISGCGQEEAERVGQQLEKAVENAGDAAVDTAKKAGNKIQQWTDQATSDEKAGKKSARAAHQAGSGRKPGEKAMKPAGTSE